jgi:colicin import membrane protein
LQDNVAAIKQAEEADRAAAKAAVAAARAAAKQERDAAALAAWRAKTNWVPKGPKKPCAKARQADQQRHAAANGSSSIDPELLGFLGGPAAVKRAAAAAEAAEAAAAAKAAAEAEAAAAAAPKPGGITVKNRGISIVRVGVKQQAEKQQQQAEEPGSPSAASVEGERCLLHA